MKRQEREAKHALLRRTFRAQLSAAPLKLHERAVLLEIADFLPRSIERGPVEAMVWRRGSRHDTTFRAQLSAAPLKRLWHRPIARHATILPRSIERGPVEAVAWSGVSHSIRPLPRSIERGPVEATMDGAGVVKQISLPRSIERGPVEASTNATTAECGGSAFRAQLSAAPLKQ